MSMKKFMMDRTHVLAVKARKRKGFSFMEILVSLVLIVSLSVGAFFMFNEAQQTRKMAQMHNDMDAIVNGLLTYESLNLDSALPDSLASLVSPGLTANESIDGTAHTNIVRSTKAVDGNFLDPWGAAYTYSSTDRTLTCNPKDSSGADIDPVVRYF